MDRELVADAVVIGSGAGGAPAAAALAEAGLDVIVLEAGPRYETRDFNGVESEMVGKLLKASRAGDSGHELYAGACVGGSTVVNDALCWPTPAEVTEQWVREHGLASFGDAAYAELVATVLAEIGAAPTDLAHTNKNARALERGAQRLGWAGQSMARNVRDCANLGLCNLGCPTGAKQSSLLTWVPRAERAGARVIASARVTRIEADSGKVRAVVAESLDPATGAPNGTLRVETPRVILAAGVLETPALLLASALGANAGIGLQFHSSVYVAARFADPVHAYYGPTMSYAITEFSDVNGHRGPGLMLENVAALPLSTASSLPGFGSALAGPMESLPFLARAVVVLRDRTRGRLELDGDRRTQITYPFERGDLDRARTGMIALARAYLASGAEQVFLPVNDLAPVTTEGELDALESRALSTRDTSLIYAVHLFGGAVMGSDPTTSCCDEAGRVRGVKGLWVSDASALPSNTGVNPQVTIMANALRVAAGIV